MNRGRLVDRLVQEVAAFATPALALKEDLINLEKVQSAGAHEAVIFYCARMLESLAVVALKDAGIAASSNACSNLESLQRYNLFSISITYWANSLRRIGNDVRHLRRRVEPEDAELAAVFLERWLVWFFCQFRFGTRLPGITHEGGLELVRDEELRRVVEILDNEDFEPDEVLGYLCGEASVVFLKSPVLPSVLAEMLMNRQFYEQAFSVLQLALKRFPDGLRLHQLMGLYYSRMGNPDEALKWLEPLYRQFKDDDETTGIMAGVYKRKWLADKNEISWLDKSYQAYLERWERSRKANAWLGANAATTALWANHPQESRTLAGEVEQLLRKRVEALAGNAGDSSASLDYWDRVTLAEVELLQGRLTDAWSTYWEAFEEYPERRDNIELSLEQADHIIESLGLSFTAERFRQPPPSCPDGGSLE